MKLAQIQVLWILLNGQEINFEVDTLIILKVPRFPSSGERISTIANNSFNI